MSVAMQRPEQSRPRSKSTFSFKSEKSHKSQEKHADYGHNRQHSQDKQHFTPETKANPNQAMLEDQPIAAALEKPTLQSLRSFQHTDVNGNPIVDPDLSNPTRSRWERPLDTIRSFEAAIDGEYRRRAQTMRNDASTDIMSGYASRRSSYYGGGMNDQNRYSQAGGGYYGSRQAAAARESWGDNGGYGPMNGQRARYSRMQSDPANNWNRYSNGQNVYPQQGYQQSRDTVNTGGSNGSQSEPYSNDPSSENSSIERGGPVMRPDIGEQYGFSGFGQGPQPILEEYGNGDGPSQNNYMSQNGGYMPPQRVGTNGPPVPSKAGPPVPAHNPNMIKLTSSQGQGPPPANKLNVLSRKSTDGSGKRKSWLKRRFSKN